MPYVTITDVELASGGAERLRQLASFEGGGAPSGTAITSAIAEASALVDRYLHFRFQVPLADPLPSTITAMVAREAVFLLKLSRDMVTDADQLAHEERVKTLEGIGSGKITIGLSTSPIRSSMVVDRVSGPLDTVAVSRESLKGFA